MRRTDYTDIVIENACALAIPTDNGIRRSVSLWLERFDDGVHMLTLL